MTTTHLSTPKEIVALLAQNGVQASDKETFVEAFRTLFPTLPATERTELLAEILAFVDSTLETETLPAAA